METDDGGPDQSSPQLNTISETHVALESSERPPLKEKVQTAKSGLNEAFTSLLTSFEVCDVIFLAAFHMQKICLCIDSSP